MAALEIHMITPASPLIITSPEQFVGYVMGYLKRGVGVEDVVTEVEVLQERLTTRQVKKLLKVKGYAVKNHQAFKAVVAHLEPEKMGRDYWYRTVDIQAIPSKI